MEALAHSTDTRLVNRSFRLEQCCSWPVAVITDDGNVYLSPGRCRDRMCGLCSSRRSHEAGERLTPIVQAMNAPRLMTLTLKSSSLPLGMQLDRLVKAFRDLRRQKQWGGLVKGGVATIEITRNPSTNEWHPHLHVIFDGSYYPQQLLKEQWHQLTGDSYIVDVRPVHDCDKASKYVAKYVGKPANFVGWDLQSIEDYAAAMHGRRTIMTFGASHNIRVDLHDDGDRPKASRVLNALCHIVRQANKGDPDAMKLVRALPHLGPEWAKWLGMPCPDEFIEDLDRRKAAACMLATADEHARAWANNGSPPWMQPEPDVPKPTPLRSLFNDPPKASKPDVFLH